MIFKKNLREKYWFYVFTWVTLLYSTLYVVRPICEFLKKVTPFNFLSDMGMILLLVILVVLFFKKVRIKKPSTYFLLLFTLMIYGYAIATIKYPEEKLHFVEYGILGFLIFRAFRLDYNALKSYLFAFILTSLFGWGDEGIQYLLPNRYYQIDDVILNSVSGALGLFTTFIYQREAEPK